MGGGLEKVQNYADIMYEWSRENNKVKEKGMIVLSSAYKGSGRTDLSCNTEAADHYTALQCAVTNHIGLW